MTTNTHPNDYPSFEDTDARDRAAKMSGALKVYSEMRHWASVADAMHKRTGAGRDRREAEGFRADARAALHEYPELQALVERSEKSTCEDCGDPIVYGSCSSMDTSWHHEYEEPGSHDHPAEPRHDGARARR